MQLFFFFIGREPTTWPAKNCLQITVCSNNILFMRYWNHVSGWKMADCFLALSESDLINGNWVIKQWLNPVIAKYRDLSVSLADQLFASASTGHWRYFAQLRLMIVKWYNSKLPINYRKPIGKSFHSQYCKEISYSRIFDLPLQAPFT